MSDAGTVGQMIHYIVNDGMYYVERPGIASNILNSIDEFIQPLTQDDTLEIRRFKSPDWTWSSLCGREFFGLVDGDGNIVCTYGVAMS